MHVLLTIRRFLRPDEVFRLNHRIAGYTKGSCSAQLSLNVVWTHQLERMGTKK
jgi:hypothetical protein